MKKDFDRGHERERVVGRDFHSLTLAATGTCENGQPSRKHREREAPHTTAGQFPPSSKNRNVN
jgi:hypothetical protein